MHDALCMGILSSSPKKEVEKVKKKERVHINKTTTQFKDILRFSSLIVVLMQEGRSRHYIVIAGERKVSERTSKWAGKRTFRKQVVSATLAGIGSFDQSITIIK